MGAAYNELMENETKESVIELYLEALRKIAALETDNAQWERWRVVARTERDKLEAENAFLKEIINQCNISDVDWVKRTFRIAATPEHWFGIKGTVGEEPK